MYQTDPGSNLTSASEFTICPRARHMVQRALSAATEQDQTKEHLSTELEGLLVDDCPLAHALEALLASESNKGKQAILEGLDPGTPKKNASR